MSKVIEYGVRYPSGDEDWNTRNTFGHLESLSMRLSFQEQYNLQLKRLGLPPAELTFLTRVATTSYSKPEVIDDTVEETEPEENNGN